MNIFKFQDTQLRTIEIDGAPWFHASDVCRCLGLNIIGGVYHHMTKLGADEKRTLQKSQNVALGVADFLGRASSATVVTESGLYKLIMRSDKATAVPFQDWVTREVLPAIRKTGGYLLNEQSPPDCTRRHPRHDAAASVNPARSISQESGRRNPPPPGQILKVYL